MKKISYIVYIAIFSICSMVHTSENSEFLNHFVTTTRNVVHGYVIMRLCHQALSAGKISIAQTLVDNKLTEPMVLNILSLGNSPFPVPAVLNLFQNDCVRESINTFNAQGREDVVAFIRQQYPEIEPRN